MHLTTQLFLFCSILSLKYSLHPPSMFVTLSALIAQPFFLLAFFFFFEMHRLHNFTSWMSSVLSYYLIANLLWSLLPVFVPPLPVSVLATSPLHFLPEFHLWRHQVSCFTLILLLTFFFCFASPCASHHLLYFCLPPLLRAQSHLCIHLSALANPLTSPAHSPASSSLTLLVALSVKGCPYHCQDYAIETDKTLN